MARLRSWILPTVAILGLLFGIIGSGWFQRPIYEYKMESYPESWDFDSGHLPITLRLKNRGKSDALITIVLKVNNGMITRETVQPFMDYNETEITFSHKVQSEMEGYEYWSFNITVEDNPENFTISYLVEKYYENSLTGLESYIFGEADMQFPITITYARNDTNLYNIAFEE